MPDNVIHPIAAPWTPARIRAKILESDTMLERSIVKIFERQTTDEQQLDITVERNGVGFTGFDAEFLSSLAKRIIDGRHLTQPQIAIARLRMVKYAKQLSKIIAEDSRDPSQSYHRVGAVQPHPTGRHIHRSDCPDCSGTGGDPSLPPCGRCEGRGYTT
jgi:hypothetical protein